MTRTGTAATPDGHARSVTVTLLLALDAADAQAPAGLARPAMDLAAVLDPAGYPEALWATTAACAYLAAYRARATQEEAGGPAEPVAPAQARAALLQLDRYGLITVDEQAGPRAVRIHALTARAARETAPARQAAAVRAAANAVLALWPDADHDQPGLTAVLRASTTTLTTHTSTPTMPSGPSATAATPCYGAPEAACSTPACTTPPSPTGNTPPAPHIESWARSTRTP